ncbi:MAG TPA: hypothetical protein VJ327_01805 [Patescibacteria group bacterium]|nr:hypothetical protein [Patescibacteria group bacterium]
MDIQLDLLEDNSEISILKRDLQNLRTQTENMRKGLFARHAELVKMYMILKKEFEEKVHPLDEQNQQRLFSCLVKING